MKVSVSSAMNSVSRPITNPSALWLTFPTWHAVFQKEYRVLKLDNLLGERTLYAGINRVRVLLKPLLL